MRLNENELKAPIPSEFGNLKSLKEFTLSGNDGFGGIIPAFITKLTNLTDLEISRMGLSGRFPDEFFDLTNLRKVFVHGNDLTGPIPKNIENVKDLCEYYMDVYLTLRIPITSPYLTVFLLSFQITFQRTAIL